MAQPWRRARRVDLPSNGVQEGGKPVSDRRGKAVKWARGASAGSQVGEQRRGDVIPAVGRMAVGMHISSHSCEKSRSAQMNNDKRGGWSVYRNAWEEERAAGGQEEIIARVGCVRVI